MPILTAASAEADWADPDGVPRPLVAFGAAIADRGRFELDPGRHAEGEIMLVHRGALSCEVDGGLWIVPPGSALWIPSAQSSRRSIGRASAGPVVTPEWIS